MNKKVNLETKVMNSESMKIGNVLSLFDGMSCG